MASSSYRPTDGPPARPRAGGQRDLSDRLRAGGYRITPARQLVLNAVAALDHATPDTICAEVQRTASSVNLSTVYRTLELLEELGLVTHTHLGHGAPTYHVAAEQEHIHLVCRTCGRVEEASAALADPLVERLRRETGFAVDVAHFAIYGQCAQCREAADAGGTSAKAEHSGEDCAPHGG